MTGFNGLGDLIQFFFWKNFQGGKAMLRETRGGSWVGAKASQVKAQGGQTHFQGGRNAPCYLFGGREILVRQVV